MSKTMMIVGFGPGTATALAEKFGAKGFTIALVGRNQEHVTAGVNALKAQGINAFGFTADAGDPDSIRGAIRAARSQIGPLTVLQWNAYSGVEYGDLLNADVASLKGLFDVPVFGLLAAVKEVLPDLKADASSAIFVANGAFGADSAQMDATATRFGAMGLALTSGAKHKVAGLLAERLKAEGVYLAEVMVYGTIKGTPGNDAGNIDPAAIADKYWELYESRGETRAAVKPA